MSEFLLVVKKFTLPPACHSERSRQLSIVGEVEPDPWEGAKRNLAEQVMIGFRDERHKSNNTGGETPPLPNMIKPSLRL